MTETTMPLVHVRTPTYRRPEALDRALRSLQAQTFTDWHCDVYDDDREQSGRAVCEALEDPRVAYHFNIEQKFASANINHCFTSDNPLGADYFFVLEDDNYVLDTFIEENIAALKSHDVEIVLRNQFVEFDSGTDRAHLSTFGIFDRMFLQRVYRPEEFRLSLIPGIGVSNGSLFWSRHSLSKLEIDYSCTATFQEYMRTFSVSEPIFLAMAPLAVWAKNGENTTRDLGAAASYLRRELDLKRSIQVLQGEAWRLAGDELRREFLSSSSFGFPAKERAKGLVKGLLPGPTEPYLSWREKLALRARGMLIRMAGRNSNDLDAFVRSRTAEAATSPG